MPAHNARQPVRPGDTFIAYVDDSTCCVGVAIEDDKHTGWKTLILGYFQERLKSKPDVFDEPLLFTFPGYLDIKRDFVVPYDFRLEIELCKARNSTWWKSLATPCYTNLVARHFRPRQIQELQYISMARHILTGGVIDDLKSFGSWSEETFLKIWAVLYRHFPERVAQPPRERDSVGSNIFYTIDLECDPPQVTWGIRPIDYKKDPALLSRY